MNAFHFPWLLASITVAMGGAAWVRQQQDTARAYLAAVISAMVVLLLVCAAEVDLRLVEQPGVAVDPLSRWLGWPILALDALNSLLLPYAALLSLLLLVAAPRVNMKQFSLARTLVSEAIVLATLSCREPSLIAALLIGGILPTWLELRGRINFGSGQGLRVFSAYMAVCTASLVLGGAFAGTASMGMGMWCVATAILIRQGLVPFHSWVPELFEAATLGTALAFVAPMVSAYALIRMVVPVAPDWFLHGFGVLAMFTALYSAGMTLVQRDARRLFCYLLMSHSALVCVGLGSRNAIALTGGLCLWLSSGLALTGFGLTIWWLEARRGRLSLTGLHGGYEHTPLLAGCFLLTGLGSVGFPGTLGFVGAELMVDGSVQAYPVIGLGVVFAAALNGIAVVQAYFTLFTGRHHVSMLNLRMRVRERIAILVLAALLLIGGLLPQSLIISRYTAATTIFNDETTQAD
ncbi:MAG TPA: proton-conducting transporter membrane subunit [Candidatus Binatia bacterium]|nr:proton-conducting transporter membrane subunit [Candidatus Binatia bacterium]